MAKLEDATTREQAQRVLREQGFRPFLEAVGYDFEGKAEAAAALAHCSLEEQWSSIRRPEVICCVLGSICDWRMQAMCLLQALTLSKQQFVFDAGSKLMTLPFESDRNKAREAIVAVLTDANQRVQEILGMTLMQFEKLPVATQCKVADALVKPKPELGKIIIAAQVVSRGAEALFHRFQNCCPPKETQDCFLRMVDNCFFMLCEERGYSSEMAINKTPEAKAVRALMATHIQKTATVDLLLSRQIEPMRGANVQAN